MTVVTGTMTARTTVFCDVTEHSVLRGRNRMLHNDVTEMNLSTHWAKNNASAADTFSTLPS